MVIKINGEKPFSVVSDSFAISPSNEGYNLEYSVDGNKWTSYEESVPANEVLVVAKTSKELFYRCVGNASDLIIKY